MKNPIKSLTIIAITSTAITSCQRDNNTDQISIVTAKVYNKHVDYVVPAENITVKGLKIQESNSNEWKTIPSIEDFNYEENYDYNLKLEKTLLANPPMDAQNPTYRLIEIISKSPSAAKN